jgi:hypothetical protein
MAAPSRQGIPDSQRALVGQALNDLALPSLAYPGSAVSRSKKAEKRARRQGNALLIALLVVQLNDGPGPAPTPPPCSPSSSTVRAGETGTSK